VNVRRSMIVRVDDHAERAKPEDGWHAMILAQNQIAWVICKEYSGRGELSPSRIQGIYMLPRLAGGTMPFMRR
jgi:hypothetical protein